MGFYRMQEQVTELGGEKMTISSDRFRNWQVLTYVLHDDRQLEHCGDGMLVLPNRAPHSARAPES